MSELPSPPNTLFGVPLLLERQAAEKLENYLVACWRASLGVPPKSLTGDIQMLDSYFNPIRVGRAVREAVMRVTPSEDSPRPDYTEQLVLTTTDGRRIVTPEGRVVIACLREAQQADGPITIRPETVLRAQHALLESYRSWSQQRLRRVLQLVNADDAPLLLPPGLGVLMLLLVNRSTSEDRAIVVPAISDPRAEALERAFSAVVSAFADDIAPSKRGRQVSLYSTYAVSEVRRRLPYQLSKQGARLFIAPGHEKSVLEYIVNQLRRRRATSETVARAFDELVRVYRAQLPVFAQFGAAHERPAETKRIRHTMLGVLRPQ